MTYEKPEVRKEGELKTEAQIIRSQYTDIITPIP